MPQPAISIVSLELTNIRQFAHKRLDFRPGLNLLVGENGAGKSTVLRTIMTMLRARENFRSSNLLSDEDIRYRTETFTAKLEYLDGDTTRQIEIQRNWRGRIESSGHVPRTPVIWFGSNEAITTSFTPKKRHLSGPSERSSRRERDYFWEREEFLFHEEYMESPEGDRQKFGRSDAVRRWVGEVLSRFSPKFERFSWRFVPYDCRIILPREHLRGHAAFRREVRADLMRHLEYDLPRRRRGWDSRSVMTFKSNGEPLASERGPLYPLPEIESILRHAGERHKIEGDIIRGTTIELKLAPRISVTGPDGPMLLSQLSDGEKRIFSMIVDIGRRLSLQPGGWREIGAASGIVAIDEIDCHLHPKWQRMVVHALQDLFPAVQFIASTHSPFVVQGVEADQLQSLGRPPLPDFTDRGIEEIAFKVMRIENPEVSRRYLELLKVAKEYYALAHSGRNANTERRKAIRLELESLSGRFSRNPAFQAFLEMKGEGLLGVDPQR